MTARVLALFLGLTIATSAARASTLPVYIEDSHAGTFYWLAQHVDLEAPCTLVHFDAHSDATGIFDSDKIRDALRHVASTAERQELLAKWRATGAIQCFNWIEPLMPAPVTRVIWVPGNDLPPPDLEARTQMAARQLDGHLEAAPRHSGTFRERYIATDLRHLPESLQPNERLIVTIDLDSFSGLPTIEQAGAFARVWNFVVDRKNVRAVTFAISREFLKDDDEADRLLCLALQSARLLPTAHIEFEPFATVANDRSTRAQEFREAGETPPVYDIRRASQRLRSILLTEANRIVVEQNRPRWDSLVRDWQNEAAELHLEVAKAEPSTDGAWRIPARHDGTIEIVAKPWNAKLESIEWSVLTPAYSSCNVSDLLPEQVGFVAQAAPIPQWKENTITHGEATLPIDQLDKFFDPATHCGSVRLRVRAMVGGIERETPVLELRRFDGSGFRAALTEQFGLPYLFGSDRLADRSDTGPETNLGADCANFLVYAMRRQGLRIPWSDPKQLRQYVEPVASRATPNTVRFSAGELERGLIVHLGTHVAAVMEDRPPLGVLDEGDIVAHQLKGLPEKLTLHDLRESRHANVFDVYRVPGRESGAKLMFGGDVMLGRTCAERISAGADPFSGIRDLFRDSQFTAANLECTIATGENISSRNKFAFLAPLKSAEALHRAGFHAVGLANNHALDFGTDALQACAQILRQNKVEPVDQSKASIFKLANGRTLALFAISDLSPAGQHLLSRREFPVQAIMLNSSPPSQTRGPRLMSLFAWCTGESKTHRS
jgi:hypothetical protein